MRDSLMIKSKKEVEDNELMAYVMSKISSFAWVRVSMFSEENIYEKPPIFCWRYTKNTDEEVYHRINECVSKFEGNIEWQMNKGSGLFSDSGRNYGIQPKFVRDVYRKYGFERMPKILESDYKQELQKALRDVPLLAAHIEREFGLKDTHPIPVTIEKS